MRSTKLIIVALFLSLASAAQDTASRQSIFWEVSGNGLVSPSYLYGTMHRLCKRDIQFSDTLLRLFASCRSFFKETVFDGDTSALFDKRPDGITLTKIIGKNEFKRVKHFFANDPSMTDSVLNALSVYNLETKMIEEIGKCETSSVDKELWLMAKANNMSLNLLETIEEHMKYETKFSISDQADYASFLLNNIEKLAKVLRNSISWYFTGDVDKMYELFAHSSNGAKTFMAIDLGDRRNKIWLPRMEKAMAENSCFFAFGCMHLPGPNGIVSMLRDQGYVVRAIHYY